MNMKILQLFPADASFLDEWSFDQLESLLNRSNEDARLKYLLHQDKIVIFLHLLGCDSNGHAHRPFSSIYLNNVKVVDRIAERVYNLLQNYFDDDLTAYVFTADHGMSDKGSHGDGHPSNTDTPLVAWGAGVQHPTPTLSHSHSDHSKHFVDDHAHDMPTPSDWGLDGIERLDVNQADIAPLMSSLVGLPCPANSVGSLPLDYINLSKAEKAEAVFANTKQILKQFLRKSELKQSKSLNFKPFKPLENYASTLEQIEHLILLGDNEVAIELSVGLRSLALEGLHYFQTYDWLMLMTIITLGYLGWMIYILLHVMKYYTILPGKVSEKVQLVDTGKHTGKVYLCGCLLLGLVCGLFLLEQSPPLYHAYAAMTIFLWTQIFSEYRFILAVWRGFVRNQSYHFYKLAATCIFSLLILELLVKSFTDRKLYTWCFLTVGISAPAYLSISLPWKGMPIFIWLASWFLSVFTLMPAEIPDNIELVIASGFFIIISGISMRYLELHASDCRYLFGLVFHESEKPKFPMLFQLQIFLVGLSSLMVPLSTSHRTEKQELHALHQLINWSIAVFSMVLPLFSGTSPLSRLTSIFLGFAPPFLLLSIGYEALFYFALAVSLLAWLLYENACISISTTASSASINANQDKGILEERYIQLSDMRIALTFMVFFNIAFFGTGNFASIASFEISSVYRFITIFSPFLMAGLLIFKLLIPFILVICVFSSITKLVRVSRLGCYFLVVLCSDVMTIHFFFLVQNTGSWMEIGNSISHFGIMSAQVVFVLMLFALTNIYTKDIQTTSARQLSRKVL